MLILANASPGMDDLAQAVARLDGFDPETSASYHLVTSLQQAKSAKWTQRRLQRKKRSPSTQNASARIWRWPICTRRWRTKS